MKISKNNSKKREPRNLGVTVVAGFLALLFGGLTLYISIASRDLWIYEFVFGFLAVISFGVAMYGRKSFFAIMAELFFWVP